MSGHKSVFHIIVFRACIISYSVPVFFHYPVFIVFMKQIRPGFQLIGKIFFAFISKHYAEDICPCTGNHLPALVKIHAPAAGAHCRMDILHVSLFAFNLGISFPDSFSVRLFLFQEDACIPAGQADQAKEDYKHYNHCNDNLYNAIRHHHFAD